MGACYEQVAATDCPEIVTRAIDIGDAFVTGSVSKSPEGLPCLICPRRTVLDKILVDAAVEAGVELARDSRFGSSASTAIV